MEVAARNGPARPGRIAAALAGRHCQWGGAAWHDGCDHAARKWAPYRQNSTNKPVNSVSKTKNVDHSMVYMDYRGARESRDQFL